MDTSSVLWRRLDTPGHDACRFERRESGWEIDGTAVFRHHELAARLSYHVACDSAWRTTSGKVRGFVGIQVIDVSIERASNGTWRFNGQIATGFERLVHLDLSFTPATNFQQLRQLELADGGASDLPVVWLDVPPSVLRVLPQRYERRGDLTYWYEAPSVGYAALLEITSAGFIRRYPGLWELEE
jgi:uncharacterized protein